MLIYLCVQIKDFKDVPGVGMGHQLLDKEGRKPLADKDLKTLTPVEPAAKDDGKGKGDAAPAAAAAEGGGGGGGGGGEAAPAQAESESGGGGGGDDGGAPAGEEGGGGEEGAGGDGEVKAATVRPVSVANQTQCCGGLKSGVCTLI